MKPVLFVGPSLHGTTVPNLAAFDAVPPAGCGDVMRAVLAGRKVIGLIDGVFESRPAVWHKEILFALNAGCHVFGSASMGALRAAECWSFGMVGIGRIFEDYRSGRRIADADVALLYGPAEMNYLPLTVPLVDVADVIERMLAAGVVDSKSGAAIDRLAKETYFKDRTWRKLLSGTGVEEPDRTVLMRWIAASGPAAKTRDALALISRLAEPTPPAIASASFLHTQFSTKLLERLGN